MAKGVSPMTDQAQMSVTGEDLRQSREDLSRAQAVGLIGSWRLDVNRNILTWSDENYRIFGLPIGTPLTYETFLSIVHPDDRSYVDREWKAGLRGEPYDIEHRLLIDGQVKWVREKAFLEHDQDGNLLGGFGITQDVTDRKAADEALRKSESERAKQQERARLARDLHDSVSQTIFAASLKAESLCVESDCADYRTAQIAADVRRLCIGAQAQLRSMLLELRGEGLEEVPMQRLMRQLVDAVQGRANVHVELEISGASALPAAVHVAFYRVAQEALNNVARHAKAKGAAVQVVLGDEEARLEVRDNGCGFEQRSLGPEHLGLRSMHERAADAGGELEVISSRGQGTRVILTWRRTQPAD
jgi:PAS domain S-box-containing protein